MLLTVKFVVLKRGNYDPISTVKITEWRKFIDYSGQSIEANLSRAGKNKIYICHIGYIPRPSSVKLNI